MRKLMLYLVLLAAQSWSASVMVGAGRTYTTVKAAILAKLPLQDDLTIYVEMPTENYAAIETIVPDASWNGRQVTVRGLKWMPEVTGYIDNDVVYEWAGDEVLPTAYNFKGPDGVDGNASPTGTRRAYFKDHLGSTRMAVSDDGQIKEATMYSAYGKEYWVVQPAGNLIRETFTGKEFDDEGAYGAEPGINLFYFGVRYYDPDIGMWISADPERQFSSPYSYTGNGVNPINSLDPDGNWTVKAMAGYGYAAGGEIGYNQGRWTFGLMGGFGLGAKLDMDMTNKIPGYAENGTFLEFNADVNGSVDLGGNLGGGVGLDFMFLRVNESFQSLQGLWAKGSIKASGPPLMAKAGGKAGLVYKTDLKKGTWDLATDAKTDISVSGGMSKKNTFGVGAFSLFGVRGGSD